MEPEDSLPWSKEPASIPGSLVTFHNSQSVLLWWGAASPSPNSQAIGPPLVGYVKLIIRYIRTYCPYLEAVSSIRKPRNWMCVEKYEF